MSESSDNMFHEHEHGPVEAMFSGLMRALDEHKGPKEPEYGRDWELMREHLVLSCFWAKRALLGPRASK